MAIVCLYNFLILFKAHLVNYSKYPSGIDNFHVCMIQPFDFSFGYKLIIFSWLVLKISIYAKLHILL